ncbi:lipid A-modifier LpxR family protein [Dyadobacter subterraneus]|uniref:Lipid A deacylase LpxR family protein n=1 Tax=Dyadobacter subterraneus TaxID=2773304 RepID=A0ABR9WD14_9BACT|nr:lipid A deacylase LpxR family protein [Dyadobacter subterraneus]MBE9463376.1 lipid A deacylase LpxR family protein [Dyadobacter subterraneus]
MKKILNLLFFSLLLTLKNTSSANAQSPEPTRIFRFYEDNDFLNIRGDGTDRAYTNGVRLDIFYQRKSPSKLPIDYLMPKAGKNSVDTYGWSVMQIMITPNNLTIPEYQSNDYPYSGALFITHSLFSSNQEKKYNFQTELIAGMRGPASFAKQTQEWIHHVINDEKPMGWQNQCNSKALINLNFAAEKQLAGIKKFAEIIGGAQISAGTMTNSLTIYPLIRIGKINPYFNGFISQFSTTTTGDTKKKMQFYFFIKPKLTLLASNAIMHGGIQRKTELERETEPAFTSNINHYLAEMDFGAVINKGNFSISYTQKPSTAYNKGLYSHNVGNISLYFCW